MWSISQARINTNSLSEEQQIVKFLHPALQERYVESCAERIWRHLGRRMRVYSSFYERSEASRQYGATNEMALLVTFDSKACAFEGERAVPLGGCGWTSQSFCALWKICGPYINRRLCVFFENRKLGTFRLARLFHICIDLRFDGVGLWYGRTCPFRQANSLTGSAVLFPYLVKRLTYAFTFSCQINGNESSRWKRCDKRSHAFKTYVTHLRQILSMLQLISCLHWEHSKYRLFNVRLFSLPGAFYKEIFDQLMFVRSTWTVIQSIAYESIIRVSKTRGN